MADTEDLRSFLDREAAKEFQFDDAFLLWIDSPKFFQGFMQSEHVEIGFRYQLPCTGDGKLLLIRPASLRCFMLPRMVYQNAAHELCGNAVKLCAVLPPWRLLVDQLQICLINQRRRLQRMVPALVPQIVARQPAQLALDQGYQLIESLLIAVAPTGQELGYGCLRFHFSGRLLGEEGLSSHQPGTSALRGSSADGFYLNKFSAVRGFREGIFWRCPR